MVYGLCQSFGGRAKLLGCPVLGQHKAGIHQHIVIYNKNVKICSTKCTEIDGWNTVYEHGWTKVSSITPKNQFTLLYK